MLFQFPSLCSQYFKLIEFLTEMHPDKFIALPEELFRGLMASVELGLSSYPLEDDYRNLYTLHVI